MPKSKYSAGARKALAAMKKKYGAKEGQRIFYAKANEKGSGKTLLAKVNSVYKKGAHVGGKRKKGRKAKR